MGSSVTQSALDAFGLHGVVHLDQSALTCQSALTWGYTPGAVTSPLVVIPFTLWARGRLRRAGVLRPGGPGDVLRGLGFAAAVTAGTHLVARRVLRAR
ncbi:HXXEE domain-containing protein [Streptomyces sp. NPDC005435]|uniref:HXXEE domain-containing protein n=1 Tax=Streptomyces sp. NPDC005435 TaxID=3154464 RepID=UPI00387EB4E0